MVPDHEVGPVVDRDAGQDPLVLARFLQQFPAPVEHHYHQIGVGVGPPDLTGQPLVAGVGGARLVGGGPECFREGMAVGEKGHPPALPLDRDVAVRLLFCGSGADVGDARLFERRPGFVETGRTVIEDMVVGQPDQVESLARKYFNKLPEPAGPLPDIADEPAISKPELYVKQKSPDRRVAGIHLGFRGMKLTETNDVIPMAVLDTIISGYRLPTGWLHKSLREGDASYVYEVHAINVPGLSPGYFGIYAACQPTKVGEVYRIINNQLDKARVGQFTQDELERAKTIIVTSELMGRQTNSDRAMQSAIDELYGLGYDNHEKLVKRVRAVTLEEVKRVANKYLTAPIVAIVTPAPDQVDLGIEPVTVDSDEQVGAKNGDTGR